jgi:hypothetical protein
MTAEEPAPDLGALLSQLGQVQQSIQDAQESAAAASVEGSAGGGAVRIGLSGAMEVQSVSIDPSVVDPAEVEMLEDLVLAAMRDALEKVTELQTSALSGIQFGAASQGGASQGGQGLGGLGAGVAGLFDPELSGSGLFGSGLFGSGSVDEDSMDTDDGPAGSSGGQLGP